jgi:hypothetical protein
MTSTTKRVSRRQRPIIPLLAAVFIVMLASPEPAAAQFVFTDINPSW